MVAANWASGEPTKYNASFGEDKLIDPRPRKIKQPNTSWKHLFSLSGGISPRNIAFDKQGLNDCSLAGDLKKLILEKNDC